MINEQYPSYDLLRVYAKLFEGEEDDDINTKEDYEKMFYKRIN